jgi:hypothetical protein
MHKAITGQRLLGAYAKKNVPLCCEVFSRKNARERWAAARALGKV